ncbi:MAG: AmmeMemoRadiSam system protein B, partial [Bacteroidota bacterium]
VRPPICAGNTYGATPESLAAQLDELMSHAPASDKNQARALIAPHIDFRVGDNALETYAAAYRAIEATDADLFVIFGTSHHKMSDWFMLSRKDYATPAGALETDQELIDEMAGALGDDLTIDEMAHRDEHSIELQAALIRHVFPNKEIKILPVLVGGFYPQIHQGNSPGNDPRFVEFIENLGGAIDKLGRKPLYIASGDFGHIGRKFEDDYDAESKLDELREADFEMIDLLNACDAEGFFARVQREGDPWKICGAAPFYALLRIAGPERGELLRYAQWNERETLSAVSFASIAYY